MAAKRKRDHAAEYAARKAKVQRLGYQSVYQARKARKATNTPRNRPTPAYVDVIESVPTFDAGSRNMNRLRREAAAWSAKHSHSHRSEYDPDMSDAEVKAFHRAYVQRVTGLSRRKGARERRKRIAEYLIEYHELEENEWIRYELMPL